MQEKSLQYFTVIFSLLLCLQQTHPYILRSNRLLTNGKQFNDDVKYDDKTSLKETAIQKRLIGDVIIVTSMLTGLAFDIYQSIKGCCDLSPVCTIHKIYNRELKVIRAKSDQLNLAFTAADNKRIRLEYLNSALLILWTKIIKLGYVEDELLLALDEDLIPKYNLKATEIKNAVKNNNRTIKGYDELSNEFESVFATAESTALRMMDFGIYGGLKAIQFYSSRSIKGMEVAYAGGLKPTGNQKAWKWITKKYDKYSTAAKNTKLGRYLTKSRIKFSAKTKARLKFAGEVAVGFVTAGLEIWTIMKKVKNCRDKADDARDSLIELLKNNALIKKMNKNITVLDRNLTGSYKLLKNQVETKKFLNFTGEFIKNAQRADNKSSNLIEAVSYVKEFENGIHSADYKQTNLLIKKLGYAFSTVTYNIQCYTKKINTLNYVIKECSIGNSNVENLFVESQRAYRQDSKECVKTGFLVKSASIKFIKAQLKNKTFATDCILNNNLKLTVVCNSYVYADKNAQQIAISHNLTITQVQFFLNKCIKPAMNYNSHRGQDVCSIKWADKTAADAKSKYFKFNSSSVETVFKKCPKKPCKPALKELICIRKDAGSSLNDILQIYASYDTACMTNTYNECVVKAKENLYDPKNAKDLKSICILLTYTMIGLDSPLFSGMVAKYGRPALVDLKANKSTKCPGAGRK